MTASEAHQSSKFGNLTTLLSGLEMCHMAVCSKFSQILGMVQVICLKYLCDG